MTNECTICKAELTHFCVPRRSFSRRGVYALICVSIRDKLYMEYVMKMWYRNPMRYCSDTRSTMYSSLLLNNEK